MAKYYTTSQFNGYRNKQDETNLEPGHLISGAQNVVSTDGATVAIRQGYTRDGSALDTNLVGYWNLDESSGTTAGDSSGNEYDGTLVNMTDADWVTGKFNNGLDFDGTNDVVQIQNATNIHDMFDGGGSVSLYINPRTDGENNDGRIMDKTNWYISVNNEAGSKVKITFFQDFDGTDGQWTSTSTEIDVNTFTHVAVVYDNSDVTNDPKIYINNQLVALTEDSTPVGTRVTDVGVDLLLGNNAAGDRTFDGILDDVRVFNAAIELWRINQLSKQLLSAVEGSYEWQANRGVEIVTKGYDDALFIRWSTELGGDGEWYLLADGFSAVDFQFAEWWDSATEGQDLLLFVNGDSNMRMFSGGVAAFASATSNTLTKSGTETWAENGFLTAGTRSVVIDGTVYTYTGGEGTTTLTGVTPDPTLKNHTVGGPVFQSIRTSANEPASGFNNDLIAVLDNQVYIGSNTSREVYVTANDDYLDTTFSSPRTPGEGALLTMDGVTKGFAVDLEALYISSGNDFWYQTVFTTSDDNTREILTVKRLKTTAQQAAIGQSAIGKIKNAIVFISNEPTLDFLGEIENIVTRQTRPISDPIKNEFDGLTLTTTPDIKYFKNNIYIAIPADSKILVFNLDRGYWEAPWTIPAAKFAIIDGDLYFHSNFSGETFKMFQGYNDAGSSITAKARFSYQNYGERATEKKHQFWYSEGYISPGTTLTKELFYELDGGKGSVVHEISGIDDDIIFKLKRDGSIGKNSLGKVPLGGGGVETGINKFRVLHPNTEQKFFEEFVEYRTESTNQRWEILAFGADVRLTEIKPNQIIKQ
jgi:hypothetical protein